MIDPILTATAVIAAALVLVTWWRNTPLPWGAIETADNGEPGERA